MAGAKYQPLYSAATGWAQARREWRELGKEKRRQVAGDAKQGRVDADPAVADISYRWARAVLRNEKGHPPARPLVRIAWALAIAAMILVVGLLMAKLLMLVGLPFVACGPWLTDWKRRRLARRIIAAAEAPRPQK